MAEYRECRLADTSRQDKVDLRNFEEEIIRIIEDAVPGKHPKVYKDRFTTDHLERGEAIKIGRALSKHSELAKYGKEVTTFRLFDGKNVETEEAIGGRVRK